MSKKNRFRTQKLVQFLVYILGHKPYEFGLVPDEKGFVTVKELLQAIHEEPGWGFVKQGSINEILLGEDRHLFECDDRRIRTVERRWDLDLNDPVRVLPRILFTGIRKRAHPIVMEKGIRRKEGAFHILSEKRAMAERLGKRKDSKPVLLEVMAEKAVQEGQMFFRFGELFLTGEVRARHIAGPLVPKDTLREKQEAQQKKQAPKPKIEPGSFFMDQKRDMDRSRANRSKGKKKKGWKEDARKIRKRR